MNEQEHDNEYQRLRKLLKELPMVDASPDFEMKLQRRIHQESAAKFRFFASLRRIPVFAYSLVTLLLVGGISYYAFFKHGSIPSQEQVPPDHVVIPLPEKSAVEVSTDTVKEKRALTSAKAKDEGTKEADKKLSIQSVPLRDEAKAIPHKKNDAVQPSVEGKVVDQPKRIQDEKRIDGMMIHEANAAAKEMVVPPPTTMMKTENSMNRAAEMVQPNLLSFTDSIARADSLTKLDSLRRVQKQRWMDKNRRKISKPKK